HNAARSKLSVAPAPCPLPETAKKAVREPRPSRPDSGHPEFTFDVVMKNRSFFLGFPIDRIELNRVMNSLAYREACRSAFDPTIHHDVNIKFKARVPSDL